MRRPITIAIAMCAIAAAACGGSGTESPAAAAAKASVEGFGNVLAILADTSVCTFAGGVLSCPCTGGGTLTVTGVTVTASVSKGTITATTASCVDATSDMIYSGTMTLDDEDGSATFSFPAFGDCTELAGVATIVGLGTDDVTCSGEISGVCAGEDYTCVLATIGGECTCR